MNIVYKPFTSKELYAYIPFGSNSDNAIPLIGSLIKVYGFTYDEATAIIDHCCSRYVRLIDHLTPLMETNPELFI